MFYYYGAKSRSAHRYPAPMLRTVVEPFAGSAGYSMHHLREGRVDRAVLVEKDPRVVAIWRLLLKCTPEDVLNYPVPPIGESTTDLLLMLSAASNAVMHCQKFTMTARAHRAVSFMLRKIAKLLPHVRGKIEIIQGDFSSAPDLEASWYVDPPYQVPPQAHKGNVFPAGMGYSPGCTAEELDYGQLADWCRSRKGQVIVCEYANATWLPFQPLYSTANTLGARYQEGIWTSGGPPDEVTALEFFREGYLEEP